MTTSFPIFLVGLLIIIAAQEILERVVLKLMSSTSRWTSCLLRGSGRFDAAC